MKRGRRFSDRPRRLPSARELAAAAHEERVLLRRRALIHQALTLALDALRSGGISTRQYDRDHARLSRELWQVDFELQRLAALQRVR
jgi:hypothetical protein